MARSPNADTEQIELAAERLAGRTLYIHHLWVSEKLRTRRGRVSVALALALLADDRFRFLIIADDGAWLTDFLRLLGFRLVAGPDAAGLMIHKRRADDVTSSFPDDVASN